MMSELPGMPEKERLNPLRLNDVKALLETSEVEPLAKMSGGLDNFADFFLIDGFNRPAELPAGTRLDLDKNQVIAPSRDNVDLSAPVAVITTDDVVSSSPQVANRFCFTTFPQIKPPAVRFFIHQEPAPVMVKSVRTTRNQG